MTFKGLCPEEFSEHFYDKHYEELEDQNDKLARIACKIMTALEEAGAEDFLLLKDEEVREWWASERISNKDSK